MALQNGGNCVVSFERVATDYLVRDVDNSRLVCWLSIILREKYNNKTRILEAYIPCK